MAVSDQDDYDAIARACLTGYLSDPVHDVRFDAIGL
jgi:hypothetical protein